MAQDQHGRGCDETLAIISRFHDAFNRHDVDALMALMTEDCVFEHTLPRPDGARYAGWAAVRACWEDFFRSSPHATFEVEERFAAGERAVERWIYRWIEANGSEGHVRGVDIFRVRAGKVCEKLSYIKG